MIAALNPQFWWWLARATGIVAWVMAIATVAWGLTMSGRFVKRRRLPAWLLDLHRYLGTLTLAFVAIHIAALVADSWTYFGVRELFVPMASEWRPRAVTWGIIALYGLVIIQVTSWGMRFLPRKVWHSIHLTSYLVFIAATVHGALSGADRMNPLVQGIAIAGVTMVLVLTLVRVLARRPDVEVEDAGSDRAAKIAAARTARAARPANELPPSDPVVEIAAQPVAVAEAAPAQLAWRAPTLADQIELVAPSDHDQWRPVAPAAPAPPAPIDATEDAELDPELAARLARLGSRVKSRSGAG